MENARPTPPEYVGRYKEARLEIDEAREKVKLALVKLFEKDALLLSLDVTEECIVHKFAEYLTPQFDDLHVDVEYNGWQDRHPKYMCLLEAEVERLQLKPKEVYPDLLVHWRRHPTNVMVVEAKKSTNKKSAARELDHYKLSSFTAPELLSGETFHYHVGLLLDFRTGKGIEELLAEATWYVDGKIAVAKETLCRTPYNGP